MGSIGRSTKDLERGFSLIELMVVLVIIGVLLLVAIPTLFGAKDRANAAAAKQRATQAIKTQKTLAADATGYVGDVATLHEAESSLTFEPLPDGGTATEVQGVVYVRDVTADTVTVVARAPGGVCYWAHDEGGITLYAKGGCRQSDAAGLVFGTKWP